MQIFMGRHLPLLLICTYDLQMEAFSEAHLSRWLSWCEARWGFLCGGPPELEFTPRVCVCLASNLSFKRLKNRTF